MTPSNKELGILHDALAAQLLEKVQSGTATAAELNVARQFLRDNGISAMPTKGNPLGKLAGELPFPGETENERDLIQ